LIARALGSQSTFWGVGLILNRDFMPTTEVTELLHRIASGDKDAEAELIPRVYRELRRIAQAYLRKERQDHTLQATALVHEAYLRLTATAEIDWKSRTHFFAVAANTMRRILVDYARHRAASRRSGERLSLDDNLAVSGEQCAFMTELDEALDRLANLNPRQARVVELRFFGGLTEEEIASVLQISSRSVKRDWTVARAWLHGELSR
jgi:RNA polymerase sigma-70 factor (ECF subfamily)